MNEQGQLLLARPHDLTDDGHTQFERPRITDAELAEVSHRRKVAGDLLLRLATPFDEEISRLERELEQLRQDRAQAIVSAQKDITWYDMLLCDYALRRREESGEKSVKLPYLTIQTRTTPMKVEVPDAEKLPPQFQRKKVEADLNALKAHIKDTGEVPEGVLVTPEGVKAEVKPREGA